MTAWMGRKLDDFGALWPAERRVADEMGDGMPVRISNDVPTENAPHEHQLRASFVRYLALGGCAKLRPPDKGLQIVGARIFGDGPKGAETPGLDLVGAIMPVDLTLAFCYFNHLLSARGCSGQTFNFHGSTFSEGLCGDGLAATGSVFLRQVKAKGEVRLLDAVIGGGLECNGASFEAIKDNNGNWCNAFSIDGLAAKGGVFLELLNARGTVRLVRATLVGSLCCDGATFAAEQDTDGNWGDALQADGLTAGGDVLFRNVKAKGSVLLRGAVLGGSLICDRTMFAAVQNINDTQCYALCADGLNADGNVFLRQVKSEGTIRFVGATLGGDLSCEGARLTAVQDMKGGWSDALSADKLTTKGGVSLQRVNASGAVRLVGATLGEALACNGARFAAIGAKVALQLEHINVTGTFYWRDNSVCKGLMSLHHAKFGSIYDDLGAWPAKGYLDLDQCQYSSISSAPLAVEGRLKWLSLQRHYNGTTFFPQPYDQCATVLREMGHTSEARVILIEKERLQRAARRAVIPLVLRPIWWLKDQSLNLSVRYGRQPLLAFAWLVIFWSAGTVWFSQAANEQALKPNTAFTLRAPEWVRCGYSMGELRQPAGAAGMLAGLARSGQGQVDCFLNRDEARNYPRFNPMIYSADTLLPIVDLEMQSYWIPDETKPYGAWARYYLWFQIFIGWALSLLAVAGFSGLIKTDNTT